MEDAGHDSISSPIRELRRLYRDAEAKAARLRLIVDVRTLLDRNPLDVAMCEALSAIAGFAGANMATIRTDSGDAWQFPVEQAAYGAPADPSAQLIVGRAWMGGEPLELRLSRLAFPIGADDREAIQIVADQLAVFLAAEQQRAYRERLTLDLQARERDLARLVEVMIGAQEQERRRVAYDLHDGVAQSLVSLLFHLEATGVTIGDTQLTREAIENGIGIVQKSIREVRDAIAALRPAELDDLGLEAALRARLDGIAAIELRFHSDLNGRRLSDVLEVTLYRVAQEALANAVRHSGCSQIELRLSLDEPQLVTLSVTDNGRGGAEAPVNTKEGRGVGLSAMRERMALIGGSISIRSVSGEGTVVIARAPIPASMKVSP